MYNDLIVENFSSPEYVGEIENPDFILKLGNPVCGDTIHVFVTMVDDKVSEIRFQSWGCATSIATANIFCAAINDKTVDEINATQVSDVDNMLGELEPSQYHCLEMLRSLYEKFSSSVVPA